MIKTFPLNSRADSASLKQPKQLFSYSRNEDGSYLYEDAELHLSYYYFPDSLVLLHINLATGFAKFKQIPEEQNLGGFDKFLYALMQYERETYKKVKADIITFRGQMTKLLALPYNLNDPIDLLIVPFDGQLFINGDMEIELKRRAQQKANEDPLRVDYFRRCEYSGYKFEKLATLPKPWAQCSRREIESRNQQVVNNYEQYLSVVRSGIGEIMLVLAGEVDGIWDYIPDGSRGTEDILPHFIELKTSKSIEHSGQIAAFRKKLFKTWAQSFLLGVRKVVYGFRDDNLNLKSVEIYQTDEIPILIKGKEDGINCMSAIKWYGAVIQWIKANVATDDELKSYRLSYDPGSRSITLQELLTAENAKLRAGQVLTPEFIAWRKTLQEST